MLKDRLKQLRTDKGLSQTAIGKQLNVSQQAVAKWESGQAEPDSATIVRLARFYDCSTDYLLGNSDHPAYEIRTDLPDELKTAGVDAIQILMDAELTPEEIQALVEFAQKIKKQNKDANDQ